MNLLPVEMASEAPVLVEAEKTAPIIDGAESGRITETDAEIVSTGDRK